MSILRTYRTLSVLCITNVLSTCNDLQKYDPTAFRLISMKTSFKSLMNQWAMGIISSSTDLLPLAVFMALPLCIVRSCPNHCQRWCAFDSCITNIAKSVANFARIACRSQTCVLGKTVVLVSLRHFSRQYFPPTPYKIWSSLGFSISFFFFYNRSERFWYRFQSQIILTLDGK